ncbi:MAG: metallophosphoesterase [Pseudanabaenaceae cyanobacterium bins.39]|nr:metallophosphoesterase [Pseudanabaenaceae cyanobacterium bins.39]
MKRRKFLWRSLNTLGISAIAASFYGVSRTSYLSTKAQALETTETPTMRVAAIADFGVGSPDQYAVARAMNQYYQQYPFQTVLMAGDNIYPYGEIRLVHQVFEKPYAYLLDQGVKFYAALGNHDIINSQNGQDQINYPAFNMSDRYYSFRSTAKASASNQIASNNPLVEFFALDTNSNAPWQEQLQWLEQQLSMSEAQWKIVFGHHPLYSSGMHGSNAHLIAMLQPLFAKHQVKIYLCGHDHGYERFVPINGTTYIVNGGGGAPLYPFGKSAQTAFVSPQFSFMILDIYPHKIVSKAIAVNGTVFDQSTITSS